LKKTNATDAARIELLLAELRLPAVDVGRSGPHLRTRRVGRLLAFSRHSPNTR